MTLKEYSKSLNDFIKENPDSLDLEVITSLDDEGNSFSPVLFYPSKGMYNKNNKTFFAESDYKRLEMEDAKTNAICMN
jgi:hypothetical protein